MNHLLIFDNDGPAYRAELAEQGLTDLEIQVAADLGEALEIAPRADIVLGQPALVAKILSAAGRLRWVQSTFAGIEPLCTPDLRTDYQLTGVKDIFGTLMREYVLCYILARERSLLATHRNQQDRVWQRITYRSLADITIGIVGLGSIGRSIARTANHFAMRVLGMKRTAEQIDGVERLYLPSQIDLFLPKLDYLVLVLPDTAQSRNFISRKELQLMKESAVLINVGRGVTVNQEDLIEALATEQIGGAILDVFRSEPLASDNPLWGMENVVVTPHNSAYSFPAQVAKIFIDNYKRFVEGEPLRYLVDFKGGY